MKPAAFPRALALILVASAAWGVSPTASLAGSSLPQILPEPEPEETAETKTDAAEEDTAIDETAADPDAAAEEEVTEQAEAESELPATNDETIFVEAGHAVGPGGNTIRLGSMDIH